jgi:SAM-dependent methyltransferase
VPAELVSELEHVLRCPECGKEMHRAGDEVQCVDDHRYPVVRGIPRLFDQARLSVEQRRTADAFGYSWTHYPKENPYTEEQWRDWIVPLGPPDFDGKRILDAGCGLGGFAEYAQQWGAAQVVGVDLSEAIDAAKDRLDGGRIALVQADLHRLPFARRSFDLAYSIGVLHHLPDPKRGFTAVAEMVRPGGLMFAWVYGRENNGWIVRVVDPVRKHLLRRLPRWIVKWVFSLPLALILLPLVAIAKRSPSMPYGDYLKWLGQRDLEFIHGVVFDHLVAPTSHYVAKDDFEGWFRDAGLVDVQISWRNRNSWRGLGRVPQAADDERSS